MAHAQLQRVKDENAVLVAIAKRAFGEPLSAADKEVIAEFKKARALEQRLREKYDLGGAIDRAFRNPSTFDVVLPPQDAETQKAAEADTLDGAILSAFTKRRKRPDANAILQQAMDGLQKAKDDIAAEETRKANAKPVSKQRQEIFGEAGVPARIL